ncbi:MAG TPA: hypothetical protein VJK30_02735 [Coxiellaceae bacterium]|nr:MAG: hypothetical protein A3E81_02735 [Gammaproteobacteria bacterium RIFCSPHIGHO2_12_FULL_36_30]HLB56231.1 hypothetical protein [Coxiellaceae bacterium]
MANPVFNNNFDPKTAQELQRRMNALASIAKAAVAAAQQHGDRPKNNVSPTVVDRELISPSSRG